MPFSTRFLDVLEEELYIKSMVSNFLGIGEEDVGTYVVAIQLLLLVELGVRLVDTRTEVSRVTTEGDVQVLQEGVAAGEQRFRLVRVGINTRLSVEDNDTIGEISSHDEIVLDDKGGLFGMHDEALDNARGNDTLFGVEVGRRLVDYVDVGWQTQGEDNGDSLQFTTGQMLDFLVDEIIKLEGLNDVSLELGRQEGGLDFLEEELANGALELGGDGLGLHADSHLGNLFGSVGLERSSQEATESGLSGTVLTHHDDDLGIGEGTGVNAQVEVAQGLLHGGVLESTSGLSNVLLSALRNSEGQAFVTEAQVLSGDVTIEEDVDAFSHGMGQGDNTVDGRLTIQNANEIGEIVENRQIVLDDDDVVVGAEKRADDTGGSQSLLDIEVGRGLVEHVNIGLLDADCANGETLKLTTREMADITIVNVAQLQGVENSVKVVQAESPFNKSFDALVSRADSLRNLINILGLDYSLQIILQQLGEVVLQFGTTEVLDDILPIGGIVELSKIGLELSAKNFESCTLSDTVGTNETQNISRSWHGKPVEFEAVRGITVGDLALEVGG